MNEIRLEVHRKQHASEIEFNQLVQNLSADRARLARRADHRDRLWFEEWVEGMHRDSFRALSFTHIGGVCQAKKKRIEDDPQIAQISQTR